QERGVRLWRGRSRPRDAPRSPRIRGERGLERRPPRRRPRDRSGARGPGRGRSFAPRRRCASCPARALRLERGPQMRGLYAILDLGVLRYRGIDPIAFARALVAGRPAMLQIRAKDTTARELLAL